MDLCFGSSEDNCVVAFGLGLETESNINMSSAV